MLGLRRSLESLPKGQRTILLSQQLLHSPQRNDDPTRVLLSLPSGQITNQARIFRTEMYSLLKYESLYMLSILDGFDSLAAVQQKYQDYKAVLTKKKLKLF
jgi:hypothetical protein